MFFTLSKVLWFFLEPGNAFLAALLLGLIFCKTRFRRLGKWLVGLSICFALTVTFLPIGPWMYGALENRFPVPGKLPAHVDGIVVLGGVIDPKLTKARRTPVIGGAVERITVSAELAKRYPTARLIYTGGSGSLLDQQDREADYVAGLYAALGVAREQLSFDREARNTWENGRNAYKMAQPKPGQHWILVTSAFHMPRAVGIFRRLGWATIPYPVDFSTPPAQSFSSPMSFSLGLGQISSALHEWIGLMAYWVTGKTDAAIPKPRTAEE